MVWACIWGKNWSPLISIFDKSVKRFVYIGVLEDSLVDVWQELEDTAGDPMFHQDGAKIYTARDMMAWFAGNYIEVMEWPPNFPDFNSIKHSSKRLKEMLHQRFPNIHKTKGGPETVRGCLAEALDVVWTQDSEGDILESLWESMPRRVAPILDANGWYTKYLLFFL